MEGSLQGLRVVEAGCNVLARLTGQLLADHGAEVIHIDAPGIVDFRSEATDAAAVSACNKRMATLNLWDERGRDVFLRLLSRSDFLIDGFAAGVLDRMGLGWGRLSAENRGLIVVRVTHSAQAEPLAGRMDVADSFAGHAGAEAPVPDLAGANSAVMGAMMALYHRMRTGEGQVVDAAASEPVPASMQGQPAASADDPYTAHDAVPAIAAALLSDKQMAHGHDNDFTFLDVMKLDADEYQHLRLEGVI